MSESHVRELEASIRDLEALVATADPQSREILQQQVANMKGTLELLKQSLPALEEMKKHRLPLTDAQKALFTPVPPAEVPAWVADGTRRGDVNDALMRCPAEARIYYDPIAVVCAIPGTPGVSLSRPHGLSLRFASDGRMQEQALFEDGCIRWSVTYFATGGRELVGFYSSTEPKTYIEHGLHTRFAPNGSVTLQTEYVNGTKHGWEKFWEDDGYPIVATRFSDGKEIEKVVIDPARGVS